MRTMGKLSSANCGGGVEVISPRYGDWDVCRLIHPEASALRATHVTRTMLESGSGRKCDVTSQLRVGITKPRGKYEQPLVTVTDHNLI